MKNFILTIIDKIIFGKIIPPFLSLYEHFVMFRLKEAWGVAHLNKLKNKGKNIKIIGYSRFLNPESIVIGDNVRIGYNCFLFGKGGIYIGDNTILSRNITIYSSNHNYKSTLMVPYDNEYINKPVTIGKGVWIGMGVSITPGVSIGDGAIIGMGAVISKNVGVGEVIVGSEQKVITKRDIQEFYKLMQNNKIYSVNYPD